MAATERDIAEGRPIAEIAARNRNFLMHWNEDTLRESMHMLRSARSGPFAQAVP